MRRLARFLSLAAAAVLIPVRVGAQDPGVDAVAVVNFPEVQQVDGQVRVAEPVPHSRLVRVFDVVSVQTRGDAVALSDGELLDATGFTSATLSLAGLVRGSLRAPGEAGALLVPDDEEILRVLRQDGEVQFAVEVVAPVRPAARGNFTGEQQVVRLGFPRYRVFFYNTTGKPVEARLYAYLTNG